MRSLILILFLMTSAFTLTAAAPATHVVLAQVWMDANAIEDNDEQEAFIAGTLFPDIRYLGAISRQETHKKGVTPKRLRQAMTPFISGMWLHSFVDVKREKFIKKYGVLSHLKEIPVKTRVLFLKLLEDEILWDKGRWKQTQKALEPIYSEEVNIGVTRSIARQWHQTMSDYFCQRPSDLLKQHAEKKEGFLQADAKTVAHWSDIFPEYAAEPYFIQYTEDLVEHLKRELQH